MFLFFIRKYSLSGFHRNNCIMKFVALYYFSNKKAEELTFKNPFLSIYFNFVIFNFL